jgi:uncharacterized protein (TIRG00374 family)
MLAQVLPLQLCTVAVRSLALRRHEELPLRRGAASTIYDQFFDLLIPVVLLVPSLLYVSGWIAAASFWLIGLSFLAITALAVSLWGFRLLVWGLRGLAMLPVVGERFRILAGNLPERGEGTLFHRRMVATLFGLSLLRYSNWVGRIYLVAFATGLGISFLQVASALPVILMAFLIMITPGGLGVVEWGWVGVLALMQVPATTAAEFALVSRVFLLLSAVLMASPLLILTMCSPLNRHSPATADSRKAD